MTMQKVAFTFGTGNAGVRASGSAKGKDVKSGFDNIINIKSSSGDNNVKSDSNQINTITAKGNNANDKTAAKGNVNVINNGSSVNKDIASMDGKTDDFNALCYEVVDGQLKVSLAEGTAVDKTFNVDIDALMEDIRQVVKDVLGVTDEDIEESLAENGIVMLDLLDVTILQEFFVVIQDIDEFSDILIDDNANQVWTQLFEEISDIQIEIFDDVFVDPKQFTEMIEQIMNSSEETTVGEEEIIPNAEEETETLQTEEVVVQARTYVEADAGRQQTDVQVDEQVASDNEPVVIINTENASTADNGSEDTGTGRQDVMSEGQTDIRTDERVETTEKTDVHAGESLFSQFMNRVEASALQEVSYSTENVQQLREIANQVIEAIKVNVRPDSTGLEIQLNPEHLGRVNVTIEMRDGVAVANFIVRNEMARMALENQMQTLKETFEDQGLKVESVEVTVSDFSFEQSTNEWADQNEGQGRGRRFRSDEEIEGTGNFAMNQTEEDPLAEEGSINIRA